MLVHNFIKKMINFGRIFNLKTSSRNENQLDNSIIMICLYKIILSCVFPVLYTSLTQMCTHMRNSAILPARYFSQYIIYFFSKSNIVQNTTFLSNIDYCFPKLWNETLFYLYSISAQKIKGDYLIWQYAGWNVMASSSYPHTNLREIMLVHRLNL